MPHPELCDHHRHHPASRITWVCVKPPHPTSPDQHYLVAHHA